MLLDTCISEIVGHASRDSIGTKYTDVGCLIPTDGQAAQLFTSIRSHHILYQQSYAKILQNTVKNTLNFLISKD